MPSAKEIAIDEAFTVSRLQYKMLFWADEISPRLQRA